MSAKAEEIRRILSEPVVDLWKLREMALTEGGLVNGKSEGFVFFVDGIRIALIIPYVRMAR